MTRLSSSSLDPPSTRDSIVKQVVMLCHQDSICFFHCCGLWLLAPSVTRKFSSRVAPICFPLPAFPPVCSILRHNKSNVLTLEHAGPLSDRYKATLPPGILYQSESPVEQFNIYNDNEDAVDEDGDEDADDVNVGGVDTGEEVLGAVGAQAMSMAEGGSGSLGKKKEKRMVARRQHPWTEGMVARALINGTRRLWPLPNGEQSEILDLGNGLELTLITDKGHVYGVKNAKKLDVSLDVVGWEWSPRGVCVREVRDGFPFHAGPRPQSNAGNKSSD